MFKRFDKYVARANDDNANDEALQEEIYVPEVTRNGMLVSEVDDIAGMVEEPGAQYTCSICPGKVMKSAREVQRHVESKEHRRRELLPDPLDQARKKQRQLDEQLAGLNRDAEERPIKDPLRLSERRRKLAKHKKTEEES